MHSNTAYPVHARSLAQPVTVRRAGVPRSVLATLCALLVTLVMWAGSAQPAAAHDELIETDPAHGSTLDTAPDTITLTFSGNVLDIGREIRVTDSQGESVVARESSVERQRVIQPLSGGGTTRDETYTVVWRVVSEDGHPIEGKFDYSVGQGAQGLDETTTEENASAPQAQDDSGEEPEAVSETQDSATPGWLLPVIGGVGALAVLIVVLVLMTRPKQR